MYEVKLKANINIIVWSKGETSSGSLSAIPIIQAQEREIQPGTGAEGVRGMSEGMESLSYDKKSYATFIYWM